MKNRRLLGILLLLLVATPWAAAQDVHVRVSPSAKENGIDEFSRIGMALGHAPEPGPTGRLYIHIAPGTYRERVYVSRLRPRTTLLGEGSDPSQVVITAAQDVTTSQSTFFSETVEVVADDFQADNITFESGKSRPPAREHPASWPASSD
jgi:pectinesterase